MGTQNTVLRCDQGSPVCVRVTQERPEATELTGDKVVSEQGGCALEKSRKRPDTEEALQGERLVGSSRWWIP